jgi:hypothetical protein
MKVIMCYLLQFWCWEILEGCHAYWFYLWVKIFYYYYIKDLIDMSFSFILQVTKIDGNLYLPTRYMFHFIKFIFWFCFFKKVYMLGFRFLLHHSNFYYYYCVFILCIYSICFGLLYWIYFMCFLVWFFSQHLIFHMWYWKTCKDVTTTTRGWVRWSTCCFL